MAAPEHLLMLGYPSLDFVRFQHLRRVEMSQSTDSATHTAPHLPVFPMSGLLVLDEERHGHVQGAQLRSLDGRKSPVVQRAARHRQVRSRPRTSEAQSGGYNRVHEKEPRCTTAAERERERERERATGRRTGPH